MRGFFHRNALVLILAGIFGALGIGYLATTAGHESELASQAERISELEARMETGLVAAEELQREVVDNSQGTSEVRVEADTEVIRQFMSTVANWESGEEYTEARASVMRKYQLDEGSQFMRDYFQEPAYNTDSSGTRYYVVDTEGLNSSLSSVTVKPLSVRGTEYRYLVLADIRSFSNDGKASASRTSAVYLSLDGEGRISDVSGYASASKPRSSK